MSVDYYQEQQSWAIDVTTRWLEAETVKEKREALHQLWENEEVIREFIKTQEIMDAIRVYGDYLDLIEESDGLKK